MIYSTFPDAQSAVPFPTDSRRSIAVVVYDGSTNESREKNEQSGTPDGGSLQIPQPTSRNEEQNLSPSAA
jgi:hypothetical protein